MDGSEDLWSVDLWICRSMGLKTDGSLGEWSCRSMDLTIGGSVDRWIFRLVEQ